MAWLFHDCCRHACVTCPSYTRPTCCTASFELPRVLYLLGTAPFTCHVSGALHQGAALNDHYVVATCGIFSAAASNVFMRLCQDALPMFTCARHVEFTALRCLGSYLHLYVLPAALTTNLGVLLHFACDAIALLLGLVRMFGSGVDGHCACLDLCATKAMVVCLIMHSNALLLQLP